MCVPFAKYEMQRCAANRTPSLGCIRIRSRTYSPSHSRSCNAVPVDVAVVVVDAVAIRRSCS